MMTAPRYQHLIASSVVLFVAMLVTWLSFTREPAEAFLFPKLISVFFVGFAAWNFVRAASGLARIGNGMSFSVFRNLLPGLIVALVFVFFAARELGFYVTSTIVFLTIYTMYDPDLLTNARGWGKRIFVTIIFMAVMYGLFALLLKVQTPRGLLF